MIYVCRVQARRLLEKQLTKAHILAAGHSATPKQERPPDRIKHEMPVTENKTKDATGKNKSRNAAREKKKCIIL